ncbi:MAG: hypothetical protein JWR38_824 [Mucilaginibacter sp.]|nr:hypothetical protein [Mucilaginibacter sp.]
MFIGITETQKTIFQEKLTGTPVPEGFSTGSMTYVIYQFTVIHFFPNQYTKKWKVFISMGAQAVKFRTRHGQKR